MYMDGEARGQMRAVVLYEDDEEVLLQSMLPRGRGFRERSSFTTTRRDDSRSSNYSTRTMQSGTRTRGSR